MEVHTLVCAPGKPPSPAPPQLSAAPEKRKRVRRWHHRGFTGCSTCRRRHVRCDEASPSCKNCVRLGLECDGTQGRMTFKVYGPPQESSSATAKKTEKKINRPGEMQIKLEPTEIENEHFEALVVSPTTVPDLKPIKFRFQEPISPAGFLSSSLDCVEGRYYTHFVDQVSTLLLIYDNSININPYRRFFPELARSSPSMASAMQAMGALHLANTSKGQQRNKHFQEAMSSYGEVVKSFRTRYTEPDQGVRLTDFATCLLLSLFEMMDSQHHNWAIHLKGAREIYRMLFSPNSDPDKEAKRLKEINHPLRPFLVSLLSYLDVAGACATSEGTVVEGSYWRTHGGGWEYNLGTPSLSAETPTYNQFLVELRQCWSVMMEIQASISAFGKAKHDRLMSPEQQDLVYHELLQRLVQWRLTAPQSLQVLGDLDDESLRQYPYPDVVEYAGCIEAYEKATNIFLHRVGAADRPDWQPQRPLLDMLASRILALIGKLAKDVGQLAVLWPLFTAGRETRDEQEQKYVRQTMTDLQRFGFKNVDRALEELEHAWFKQRTFPEGWVDTMDNVRSAILLP
ncbi:C6 transcription factor [Aspergillus heteromorphus CBS 117.55]|uniref:C6 transcription factor n=1 Tax=Aspergillus heteromorphus CBS 117.55 TaxID=1448321 RepID=A0A317X5A8_9EURO|nr:C6 transcription factor [Aspergillus heteromorphus CBS 117.55]PWY92128.1 C6 transcription factor [Aspergillus heteromorphus CBS 117.55]